MQAEQPRDWFNYIDSRGDRFTDKYDAKGREKSPLNMSAEEMRRKQLAGIIERAAAHGVTVDQLALRESGNERAKIIAEIHDYVDKAVKGPSAVPQMERIVIITSDNRRLRGDETRHAQHTKKYEVKEAVIEGEWQMISSRLIARRGSSGWYPIENSTWEDIPC